MKRQPDPKSRGESGFDHFYESIWSTRWPELRQSLAADPAKFQLENPFAGDGLRPHYELDPASFLVARTLDVQSGHRVLDMCAAPGGKSLVQIFSQAQTANQPTFILNDLSKDRVFRLRRVLQEHLPATLVEKIKVTARDASRWGQHEKEAYDRVLLDAPCSGERHLLENTKALVEWSVKRSKGLAQRQYALFCSAEQVLRPGGRMIYSTCAISPLENDGVIARYFERKGEKARLRVVAPDKDVLQSLTARFQIELEPSTHGYLILPDRSGGAGPMFFSLLEKF